MAGGINKIDEKPVSICFPFKIPFRNFMIEGSSTKGMSKIIININVSLILYEVLCTYKSYMFLVQYTDV